MATLTDAFGEDDVRNGTIWESPSHMIGVVQFLDMDQWALIGYPAPAMHGGTCQVAITDHVGRAIYTQRQLFEKLLTNGWQRKVTATVAIYF